MAFTFWRPTFASILRLFQRSPSRKIVRRKRNQNLHLESLESRVLLTANLDAKILGGSLFITGYTPGARSVNIEANPNNPAQFQVSPGVGTTVNGQVDPVTFNLADLKANVHIDIVGSLDGHQGSQIGIESTSFTLPGSLFITLQGPSGDEIFASGKVNGQTYINTFGGDDFIDISDSEFKGPTIIDMGLGSNEALLADTVFKGPTVVNMGPQGNSVLSITDSTFDSSFVYVSGGLRNNVGINFEFEGSNAASTFKSFTQFSFAGALIPGGGGELGLDARNENAPIRFQSTTVIYGATVVLTGPNASFTPNNPILVFSSVLPLSISTTTLPNWTKDLAGYSQRIDTFGGLTPISFRVSAGALPTGLTLNTTTGRITGTPTVAGTANFTIEVKGAGNQTQTQVYTVVINPPVDIVGSTLAAWTKDKSGYSQTVGATGGTGAVTFAKSSGTLPAGITLATNGQITGTPTQVGTFQFNVTATDSIGASDTASFSITINSVVSIDTTTLSPTTDGVVFNRPIAVSGGTGGKTLTVVGGSLPPNVSIVGLSLQGSPNVDGVYNFTLRATDQVGATDDQDFTLTVNEQIQLSAPSNETTETADFWRTITRTGGTGPFSFVISVGQLPNGLSIDSATGMISGKVNDVPDLYNFTVQVTDSVGADQTLAMGIQVNPIASLLSGIVYNTTADVPFSTAIAHGPGTPALTFSAMNLPMGLSIDPATGIISGTPTVPGSSQFTVTVTDSVFVSDTETYTINIANPVAITTATLADWTQDFAGYNQSVSSTGGTGAITYSLTGSLPTGLSLNSGTGAITGTPTVAGVYNFTIEATDAVGSTASQNFAVTINDPLNFSPETFPNGFKNLTYNQFSFTTGGTGTRSVVLSNINNNEANLGVQIVDDFIHVIGTVSQAASISFTATVTDSVGASFAKDFTINFQ